MFDFEGLDAQFNAGVRVMFDFESFANGIFAGSTTDNIVEMCDFESLSAQFGTDVRFMFDFGSLSTQFDANVRVMFDFDSLGRELGRMARRGRARENDCEAKVR
jgi:hypothetical protein